MPFSDLTPAPELPAAETREIARVRPKANLDFLRAIAVIFVVVDHTSLALHAHLIGRWDLAWLGTLGVFMFFVHTSLVLMWSLERRPYVLDFYIRRIFRIYPLALLAIAVAVLTHAPTAGTVEHFFGYPPHTPMDVLAHCLLLQNLRPETPPLVNVMWTLPLEVEMYVALPALFAFARQIGRIWPLFVLWALVCAFCMATFPDPNSVNLAVVVPMFLPGVMAYVGFRNREPTLPNWTFCVVLGGLTFALLLHPSNHRGWLVTLALGLTLPFFRELKARWLVRSSHYLAQYSYGIYLSHPFALVVGMYLFRGHAMWLQLGLELAIIAVVSVATYHLLELPMIQLGTRLAGAVERRYQRGAALPG